MIIKKNKVLLLATNNMLLTDASKDTIAKKYKVCRSTVYKFVKKKTELLLEK